MKMITCAILCLLLSCGVLSAQHGTQEESRLFFEKLDREHGDLIQRYREVGKLDREVRLHRGDSLKQIISSIPDSTVLDSALFAVCNEYLMHAIRIVLIPKEDGSPFRMKEIWENAEDALETRRRWVKATTIHAKVHVVQQQ